MGRGCAAQALKRWPGIDIDLGTGIEKYGNVPCFLADEKYTEIWSFPVKPVVHYMENRNEVVKHMRHKFKYGDRVPGWAAVADPDIIRRSALKLREEADKSSWEKIILPRPGCGAGELDWNKVGPLLRDILDDRFYTITY